MQLLSQDQHQVRQFKLLQKSWQSIAGDTVAVVVTRSHAVAFSPDAQTLAPVAVEQNHQGLGC